MAAKEWAFIIYSYLFTFLDVVSLVFAKIE